MYVGVTYEWMNEWMNKQTDGVENPTHADWHSRCGKYSASDGRQDGFSHTRANLTASRRKKVLHDNGFSDKFLLLTNPATSAVLMARQDGSCMDVCIIADAIIQTSMARVSLYDSQVDPSRRLAWFCVC